MLLFWHPLIYSFIHSFTLKASANEILVYLEATSSSWISPEQRVGCFVKRNAQLHFTSKIIIFCWSFMSGNALGARQAFPKLVPAQTGSWGLTLHKSLHHQGSHQHHHHNHYHNHKSPLRNSLSFALSMWGFCFLGNQPSNPVGS